MTHPTASYQPPNTPEDLVLAWIRRARESQFAHYVQATRFRRGSAWLGIPVIIITAAVGTTVFSSIANDVGSPAAKLAIGLASVLATVLSSLQTFMKLSEKSELHRSFGARYGSVRRKLEQIYAQRASQQITHQVLSDLNEELSEMAEEAPDVPSKALKIAQEQIRALQSTKR